MSDGDMETVDFIVIGSGIAGLNTSLVLAKYGKVLVITKRSISDSSTSRAQGGIAAVVKNSDSFSSHIKDTLVAGCFHNNKKAVEFLVKNAPDAIARLENLGVKFDKDSSYEAAHSFPRVLHSTDITGREIEKTLVRNVLNNSSIKVCKNCFVVDLIVSDDKCFGVTATKDKSVISIFSRAVILATGGIGQLYRWTTNPVISTGDGIAMAHRAGARLSDLEFIQFHPTALKYGLSPLFLLSEALRGEGAQLKLKIKNEKLKIIEEKRFMNMIDPRGELAPRDIVARAIFDQLQNDYEVCLDIRYKGKDFMQKRFPNIYKEVAKRGFDLTKDVVPVIPAAHFLCGGIKTDLHGQTSIKNLFAYGEAASTGVHGANRLASNSLLEGMVFSSQISKILSHIQKSPKIIPTKIVQYTNNIAVDNLRKKVQKIMWRDVGIVRTTRGLNQAFSSLGTLKKEIDSYKEINEDIYEVKNMIEVGLLITKAAIKRKKSLGCHYIE